MATGFGRTEAALTGCVRRLLDDHGCPDREVGLVLTADPDEYRPAAAALEHQPDHLTVGDRFGDCGAATGALALAMLLGHPEPPTGTALLTARTADGGAGAALVRLPEPSR
ncbi:MAG: hypothetical protein ACRDT6_26575 [Micromonosporaceae bacterium]